jgi:hypothetical protein
MPHRAIKISPTLSRSVANIFTGSIPTSAGNELQERYRARANRGLAYRYARPLWFGGIWKNPVQWNHHAQTATDALASMLQPVCAGDLCVAASNSDLAALKAQRAQDARHKFDNRRYNNGPSASAS